MAIPINPDLVQPLRGTTQANGSAGEDIEAGQVVYFDLGSSSYLLGDCSEQVSACAEGIAINSAAEGQALSILTSGDITFGSNLDLGAAYYLDSTTPGGLSTSPSGPGAYPCLIGMATEDQILTVGIITNTGSSPE